MGKDYWLPQTPQFPENLRVFYVFCTIVLPQSSRLT